MKKLFATLCTLLALTFLAQAKAPAGWMEDYDKALAKAKAEKKNLLLDFTGSDWCGYCMKLDGEVFDTAKFKAWAKENVILVQVDFPQGKKLSGKLQKQNEALKAKYGANGFPTVIVLDADEKVLVKRGGYTPGSGAEAYLAGLKPATVAKP